MNSLQHATSPYLRQHMHNPVNWYSWGEEAWERARKEDKIVLVSIGYSACHWCHVMEHESFEDEAVAALMNEHFICIKVDREERPDVDMIYMEAVQVISGHGGWPLNCFALPDGRPVHGGTYFRKDDWKKTLVAVHDLYTSKREVALDYATRLAKGVSNPKIDPGKQIDFSVEKADSLVLHWQNYFDITEGGQDHAPKFPMPVNLEFLLHFGWLRKNKFILNYVHLTLHKMAWGGIYDQLGGGFARYSVDRHWHVPHFEKMLYDNAQLIRLYSNAYRLTQNEFYRQVAEDSIAFVARELTAADGGFYSALDADSEGVEGRFYVWNLDEVKEILSGHKFATPEFINHFALYYQLTDAGNWHEEETNILHCTGSLESHCTQYQLDEAAFTADMAQARQLLMKRRSHRVRPGLDDKILTSWNALMLEALADASQALDNASFLEQAEKQYRFIKEKLWIGDTLYHTYHHASGKAAITGFLDDYMNLAKACIALYQATFNETYLLDARELANLSIRYFDDAATGMLYFSAPDTANLYMRSMEVYDTVIPSSNAQACTVLYQLGRYFDNTDFTERAVRMLTQVQPKFAAYPSGYAQWLQVQLFETFGLFTIALPGSDHRERKKEFNRQYLPNVLFAGGTSENITWLETRADSTETRIHVCTATECLPPVATVEEALKLMEGAV